MGRPKSHTPVSPSPEEKGGVFHTIKWYAKHPFGWGLEKARNAKTRLKAWAKRKRDAYTKNIPAAKLKEKYA
ncbi:MAG: hypothetical protein ABIA76_01040 [Candidatus Diapherotrites archaeon]